VKKTFEIHGYWCITRICSVIFSLFYLTGCGPSLSTPEQLEVFNKAGSIISQTDTSGVFPIENDTGPYRVVPGDILEFQMPSALLVISSDLSETVNDIEPYLCRVGEDGSITLPIVGKLDVAGKRLYEIEEMVINAYYPKYIVNNPMVVCRVQEYRRANERVFTVMGLVRKPDAFAYPPDVQYNLMEALAFAGGLDMTADPRYLKVYRRGVTGEILSATFGIDNKSLIKATGVVIRPGDIIYVDHTLQTRVNTFLSNVFYIRAGVDLDTK